MNLGNLGFGVAYQLNLKNALEKKQTFTPINVDQKWILPIISLYWFPIILPIQ
jgi:hypothetical protein